MQYRTPLVVPHALKPGRQFPGHGGRGFHLPAVAVFCAAFTLLFSTAVQAIEDRANVEPNDPAIGQAIAWKLTLGSYRETAARSAFDINLRGNRGDDVFWIGRYERGDEFRQTRLGYEHQFALPFGKLIASGQYATHGFWGGSANLELSRSADAAWFGLLGWGRTNLRPYYNLNFDPNDSTLIGAGWRPSADTQVTAYQIRDDRLDTGQRVTHLVLRTKTGDRSRVTLDVFRRSGRADADSELFRGTGVALTFDRDPWFIRLAVDPKANFTDSDMTRLAAGFRF